MTSRDKLYCDDCDKVIKSHESAFFIAQLPWDISSANKGESATLCEHCAKRSK